MKLTYEEAAKWINAYSQFKAKLVREEHKGHKRICIMIMKPNVLLKDGGKFVTYTGPEYFTKDMLMTMIYDADSKFNPPKPDFFDPNSKETKEKIKENRERKKRNKKK